MDSITNIEIDAVGDGYVGVSSQSMVLKVDVDVLYQLSKGIDCNRRAAVRVTRDGGVVVQHVEPAGSQVKTVTAGRRFSLLRSEVNLPADVYVAQLTFGIQHQVEVLLKNGEAKDALGARVQKMGDAAAVQRDFNEGKTRQVADEGDVPEKRDDGTGGQSSNDDEGFIEFQAERAGTFNASPYEEHAKKALKQL
ncbi:MAG: hypothetical protein CYPHOPRED_001684 [Cyphobasidiales sp. Tagirdzhanova-0007]|nr:MAG: hypothetical protein CYPHOPRED_001684 [Cyphobasidiales sp. Tagirdzhanova-0007]